MGTLPLNIETGRYRGVPQSKRLCLCCDQKMVEDEAHVFFKCPKYSEIREMYIKDVSSLIDIDFSLCDNDVLKKDFKL